MLIIYGSDLSSPANKVRFVANYLGLQYEYKKIDLGAGEQRKPEFLNINPVGKVPAINDDGFILSESGAIIRYFADKVGSSLYPKGLKERALVDQEMDFLTLHVGGAMQKVVFNRLFAPRRKIVIDERALEEGIGFLGRFLPIVEKKLSQTSYVAGKVITLADMTLLATLDPAEITNVDLNVYPCLKKWRENLRKQDFYTKCYKEYGESLKETAKT
ncbi:MAG: glutathione S-transferase family protein [Candidatus Omnitrophica bacterium]|nr:glutathione S-transferase family protein [Candidatus Omnitrophota bacterium]